MQASMVQTDGCSGIFGSFTHVLSAKCSQTYNGHTSSPVTEITNLAASEELFFSTNIGGDAYKLRRDERRNS